MFSLRYRDQLPGETLDEFESLIAQLRGFLSTSFNEDGSLRDLDLTTGRTEVGALQAFAMDDVPSGWLACDGAQVSRVTYKRLFERLGTTWGAGNGTTTFNLPDYRGRVILGKAASGTGSAMAETGGALDHTHSGGSHTHTISSDGNHTHGGTTADAGGHDHTFTTSTGDTSDGASITPQEENFSLATHVHTGTTSEADDHAHGISTDGAHTHGGVTGSSSGTTGSANMAYGVALVCVFAGV